MKKATRAVLAVAVGAALLVCFGCEGSGGDEDVPLTGPWPHVLQQLRDKNLLPDDPIYETDVWGNEFICGPDPVEYVTSAGPPD